MFCNGSTAVASTSEMPFLVAVKKGGIYSFEEGEWLLQYPLSQEIYKLFPLGPYIFGIGDYGTIIRYHTFSKKWTRSAFPTTQRLWDICGHEGGLIVTHGGSKLYISQNFGSNWTIARPFKAVFNPPLIRSLFYHNGDIYIGTQVHREYGGLWKYSLSSQTLTLIKKEYQSMISAIYIDTDRRLIITKGTAFSGRGSVEMLLPDQPAWIVMNQPITERAFLDLFTSENQLFTTSSKDEYGYSRIYQLHFDQKKLVPIETVSGHSFRGAGHKEQLFIAGSDESKWIDSLNKKPVYLH
jgi:hypothetical protein